MSRVKILLCVMIVGMMLCGNVNEVIGAAKCCADHPELGSCKKGVDDDPSTNGKCWGFCVADCVNGGTCKNNLCHCNC